MHIDKKLIHVTLDTRASYRGIPHELSLKTVSCLIPLPRHTCTHYSLDSKLKTICPPLSSLRSAYFSCWQLPRRACHLIRNLAHSASSMIFALQSADVSSTSTSFVDLRRSLLVGVLMISIHLWSSGFNRTFLITMRGGFEMVACIPHPVTVHNSYTIASEVATMRFLRSSGLPIPKVYNYSPLDNAAKTEYIFMEFMRGTKLNDVWLELEEPDIVSVLRQFAQLEFRMMSIPFPAGGSSTILTTRRRWQGGRAFRSATSASASVYMPGCICGTEGGRSSTWTVFLRTQPSIISVSAIPIPVEQRHRVDVVRLLPVENRGPAQLPPFLLAIPESLQDYDDPVSQALLPPTLPANMD